RLEACKWCEPRLRPLGSTCLSLTAWCPWKGASVIMTSPACAGKPGSKPKAAKKKPLKVYFEPGDLGDDPNPPGWDRYHSTIDEGAPEPYAVDVVVANGAAAKPTATVDQQRTVVMAALGSESARSNLLANQLNQEAFTGDANKLLVTAVASVPWGTNYPAR